MELIHNPRCSKSRQTLQLLKEKGINPDVRLYLKDELSKEELKSILISIYGVPKKIVIK